jgi:hypothetical protein
MLARQMLTIEISEPSMFNMLLAEVGIEWLTNKQSTPEKEAS